MFVRANKFCQLLLIIFVFVTARITVSATKNFDLFVYLKESAVAAAEGAAAGVKEYGFLSIDRAEFITLNDYISSRDITIVNEPSANQPTGAYEKARLHKMLELDEDSEENSDDDGDYDGNDSERSRDSNDSGSDDSAGSEGENVPKKKRKKNSEKDQRKKRAKKDKNAPKGTLFLSKRKQQYFRTAIIHGSGVEL